MGGRVVLVAGEPSGDRHGAALVRAMRADPFWKDTSFEGVAGPGMREAGVTTLVPMEELAVVGFVEILAHLPAILAARRRLARTFDDRATRLLVPIDYPGFNLPLAESAHARGVPVLYYIAPQVWAWGRGRMSKLAKNVDHLAAVLPFEEKLLREAGVNATYVGHPLVESLDPALDRGAFLAELGWPADTAYVALLPGSREGEIARMLDPLAEAARLLGKERPGARAVLAAASTAQAARIRAAAGDGVAVVDGRTRETLAFARAAVVASGTATLECAALGTPLVAVYRMSGPTYAIARRLVTIPRFALANIVAGEDVAPELLQSAVTPRHIVDALLPLWDDGPAREKALAGVRRVRGLLGAPGASARVAELARTIARPLP